jgi:hypothetical protein
LVVEYFLRLGSTQYLNHIRIDHKSVADLRDWSSLETIGTPFDVVPRSVDVRRIESGRGKHNIPNIGVFLWRLGSYSITSAPAFRVDARRYLFDALGKDTQLFGRPQTEAQITHLAEPINVPLALGRRSLAENLLSFYGFDEDEELQSFLLNVNGDDVVAPSGGPVETSPPAPQLSDLISICNLSDQMDSNGNVTGWIHMPQEKIAIDPVLGRIAFPQLRPPPASVRVTYHYGFSADMGGGEYRREESFSNVERVIRVPADEPDIQSGFAALLAAFASDPSLTRGAVEIDRPEGSTQDHYHLLNGPIEIPAGKFVELRGSEKYRPVVLLQSDLLVTGGPQSEFSLNGLLVRGHSIRVPRLDSGININELDRLSISHCTLVPSAGPALALSEQSPPVLLPAEDVAPRLFIEASDSRLAIDRSIVGGIRAISQAQVNVHNSIVDATAETSIAYGDPSADQTSSPPADFASLDPGAPLELVNTTVIGKVHTLMMRLASNTIFLAGLAHNDSWPAPVRAERLQQGCVRFSFVPTGSQLPRLFNCQPESTADAALSRPVFTSLRYGEAGYCQLSPHCPATIRSGADDQAEMGAFHDLYETQRESNLRACLEEYLRFGLEVGILYAT